MKPMEATTTRRMKINPPNFLSILLPSLSRAIDGFRRRAARLASSRRWH
jgi:hypothetical protein